MWFAFMIFRICMELLWASLGSLRGSWEVLGHPLGVPCRSLGTLAVLGGPSGVPLRVPKVPRGREALKTQKVSFGWSEGGPGDP